MSLSTLGRAQEAASQLRPRGSAPAPACSTRLPSRRISSHHVCAAEQHQALDVGSRGSVNAKQVPARTRTISSASPSPKVMFLGLESRHSARDGITLPLQHVELLGLNPGQTYKDSIINQRYDELISTPMEAGYSQQTVDARGELLSSVLSTIICSKGKRLDKEVVLPYELIPGALAILAEVNHDELVLYLGQVLLDSRELDGYPVLKQDVLLSMAMAKYNAARDLFATPGAQVSVGCGLLEEALHLLQPLAPGRDFIAPQLAQEIKLGLVELQSHVALEQISLPLHQADERRRGVRTIRKLLIQASDAASGMGLPGLPFTLPLPRRRSGSAPVPSPVSAEYVGRVMGQLTCEEVVALQDWEAVARAGANIKWVYPGLLERVCVAHMLHGYLQCQPGYVKVAAGVLAKLPASGEVLVLQAVCCVLTGAVQAAEEMLLAAETAAHARPSQSFLSPPSDVEVDGQVMGKLWSSQAFTFVADHTPADEDGLLPGLCLYTELWLAKVAVPLFRDTADAVQTTSLVPYFSDARVEAIISVFDEREEDNSASKPLAARALQHLRVAVGTLGATVLKLRGGKLTKRPAGSALDPLDPLGASSSMHPFLANVAATGPWRQAGAAALLLAGVVATAFTVQGRHGPGGVMVPSSSRAATAATAVRNQASGPEMGIKKAEQVVRAWQEAKQIALGPDHDVSLLPSVLAEPLLGETWRKAASFREQGWFMRYKLHRMKITEVDTKATGKRPNVTVLASLDESASLCGMDGQQADGYRSSYDAQYQMVQGKDGLWRVASVTILGEEMNGSK